jgi:hypothetical protein
MIFSDLHQFFFVPKNLVVFVVKQVNERTSPCRSSQSLLDYATAYRTYTDRLSLCYDEMGFVGCSFIKYPLVDPLIMLYTNEYISDVSAWTAKKF